MLNVTSMALAKVVYIRIDNVVIYMSLAIIAAASIILYVMSMSQWLPRFLIAKRRVSGKLSDRGIKKYVFPDGRGVVYEPGLISRTYMKKYMLFSYKGKRYIRCMFDDEVRNVYFEIVIFNNQNKIIKTMDVFVPIENTHYSEAILLPDDTSHVNIAVMRVNGVNVKQSDNDRKWLVRHLWRGRLIYTGVVSAATLLESYFLMTVVKYFLDLFLTSSYKTTFEEYVGYSGDGFALIVALVACVIASVSGVLLHSKNN